MKDLPARPSEPPGSPGVVHSAIADEVALASFSPYSATRPGGVPHAPEECDACGATLGDEAFGRGLLFWSRDGELRWEEPGLCESCAHVIGMAALRVFEQEDEES
jgi:hypothetical protein